MKRISTKIFIVILLCFSFFVVKTDACVSLYAEGPTEVVDLASIDGESGEYFLTNDITLEDSFSKINFSGILDGKNKTITVGCEGIFNNLTNATIKNVNIIYNAKNIEELSSNFGIIASNAVGTTFSQIKISVPELETGVVEDDEDAEESNVVLVGTNETINFGLVAGNLSNGCMVENCEIRSEVVFSITQNNSSSIHTYVGGIAGKLTDSTIRNTICDANFSLDHSQESFITKLNLGGVVGFLEGNKTILTNIITRNTLSTSILLSDKIYIGAFVGKITDVANQVPAVGGYIAKLVSCANNNFPAFGSNEAYQINESEYKLKQDAVSYAQKNSYVNYANIAYAWNFDSIWKESESFITLQRFTKFSLTLDNTVTGYGLGTTVQPNKLALDIKIDDGASGEAAECDYDSSPVISASFTSIGETETDYGFFFEIGRLKLNGEPTDIDYTLEEGVYSWTIPNVNKTTEGKYSIELLPKIYSIRCEPENVTQGQVRNYLVANDGFTLSNVSYGGSYEIFSLADRYFASNGFIVGEEDVEDMQGITNTTLKFNFSDADLFTKQYLINKTVDIETGLLTNIFAKFTASFVTLEFNIEIDGQNVNKTTTVKVMVNNELVELDSNDELLKKVTLNSVSISIENLPNEDDFTYILDGWTNSETTAFSFTPETADANTTKTYTIKLTTIEKDKNNSWIWWLVGGGGALILGAGITLIIVLNKNKDNSYKKLY